MHGYQKPTTCIYNKRLRNLQGGHAETPKKKRNLLLKNDRNANALASPAFLKSSPYSGYTIAFFDVSVNVIKISVLSRFMRKNVCRARLNEVSRQ
ncbi:MAG: hypothetical protein KH138_13315 [Firmicutes bacterium]|nr:hypothetical protein [Bacillota bacterium]